MLFKSSELAAVELWSPMTNWCCSRIWWIDPDKCELLELRAEWSGVRPIFLSAWQWLTGVQAHVTCRRWGIPNLQLHADDRSFFLCFLCPASVGRAAALKGQVPWGNFSHEVCESGRFLFVFPSRGHAGVCWRKVGCTSLWACIPWNAFQRSPSTYSSVFRAALAPLFWGALWGSFPAAAPLGFLCSSCLGLC